MTNVPLVDLKAQLPEIQAEVEAGWAEVVACTGFILGPKVAAFEEEFARFCGVAHCSGVGNGTDALEIALRALSIGPGDEVVVPANTFIASALAVVRCGATPVLVDQDPEFHLLDTQQLAAKLGPKTRAVMPVHLYGQCAPVEAVQAVLDAAGASEVAILEDAAQAQGAKRAGVAAGGLGRIAATSFYPGKNLGAFGDGGAVLTGSEELAERVKAIRNYGSTVKYHHPTVGFNSRLDPLQAVVLRAKLKRLATWNGMRRAAAARYDSLLADLPGIALPQTLAENEHVWHLYVVRVPNRDAVLESLHTAGIGAGIHYPVPVHLQGAFKSLGHGPGDFPVAEQAAGEILSLPLFPEIRPEQQEQVAAALKQAVGVVGARADPPRSVLASAASGGSMNCSACNGDMGEVEVDGVTIDRCEKCGGVWLDDGEAEALGKADPSPQDEMMRVKLKLLREWKTSAENPREVDRVCPRCDKNMHRVNYKDIPGLQVEKCPDHCGMFLDQGELKKGPVDRLMERLPEDEVMEGPEQAKAYAEADLRGRQPVARRPLRRAVPRLGGQAPRPGLRSGRRLRAPLQRQQADERGRDRRVGRHAGPRPEIRRRGRARGSCAPSPGLPAAPASPRAVLRRGDLQQPAAPPARPPEPVAHPAALRSARLSGPGVRLVSPALEGRGPTDRAGRRLLEPPSLAGGLLQLAARGLSPRGGLPAARGGGPSQARGRARQRTSRSCMGPAVAARRQISFSRPFLAA